MDTNTNPDTETQTVEILVERYDEAIEKLATVNKRAAKLGLPACTLDRGETYTKKVDLYENGEKIDVDFTTITVTGVCPVLPGYTFVGTIDHEELGNVLNHAPKQTIPEDYRDADNFCDHCKTKRNRKSTFVLRNTDGDFLRVGRNCLQDFVGDTEHAADFLSRYSFVRFVADFVEEMGGLGLGGSSDRGATLGTFAYTAANIRAAGWLSRGKARETGILSTADAAMMVLLSVVNNGRDETARRFGADMLPTDEDWTTARETCEYVRNLGPTSDYEQNLKVAAGGLGYNPKHLGLVASAVFAMQRAKEQEIKRRLQKKSAANSDFVGTKGERLVVEGTVEMLRTFDGNYGTTTLLKLRDADGNAFSWFASRDPDVDTGDTIKLKGTVKKHETYRDEKQTVLTRCKVLA